MGQTAIISQQILDSTSLGRDLIAAADQAAAQAILGVTGVDTGADYTWTGDHQFSGDVTADVIKSSSTAYSNPPQIRFIGSRAYLYGKDLDWALRYDHTNVDFLSNLRPLNDNDIDCGQDGLRWANVASVDGSFSGNLVSEVGGTQRVYNLGTDGDTDTEYLSIAASSNQFLIKPNITGAGTRREMILQTGYGLTHSNIRLDQYGLLRLRYYNTDHLMIGAGYTQVGVKMYPTVDNSIECGLATNRWSSVASVDGNFSGEIITPKVYNSSGGTGIDVNTSDIRFSRNGFGTRFIMETSAFKPAADDSISSGASNARWANTYSVDGDFSGTLTANTITSTGGNLTLQRNSADAIAIGGSFIQCYHEIRPASTNQYSNGTSALRWSNTYSVDGSFSGNLNIESGGSQRVYNLGAEGDADSEYLETSWSTNEAIIQPKTTGTGVGRKIVIGLPNANHIKVGGTAANLGSLRYGASDKLIWGSSYVAVLSEFRPFTDDTYSNGTASQRWSDVYSVDGSFSGNLNVESGGSQRLYNLGAEGDTDTEYGGMWWDTNDFYVGNRKSGTGANRQLNFAINGSPRWAISTDGGLVPVGSRALGTNGSRPTKIFSVDGSFSGNLNVESGGSQRVYNLGAEGDTDTEYLETSWDTNVATIFNKNTGAGTLRNVELGNEDTNLSVTSNQVNAIVGGAAKFSFGSSTNSTRQTFKPSITGIYECGTTSYRWSNVASVDGDFSGRVLTTRLENVAGSSYIRVSGQTSSPIKLWRNTAPQGDNAFDMGADAERFRTVYSANGSFSGNLNVESGGSQKFYNLGAEGDADTEFLSMGWINNDFEIVADKTGSGTLQDINVAGQTVSIKYWSGTGFSTRLQADSGSVRVYRSFYPSTDGLYPCGLATNRWSSVASVDGDFSGTLNATIINDPTNTFVGLRVNGSEKFTVAGSYVRSWQDFIPTYDGTIELGRSTNRWEKTWSVDGSFSGNLNVESGGSQRVYNLGADGDTDTEYFETSFDTNILQMFTKTTGAGVRRNLEFGNADNQVNVKGASDQVAIRTGGSSRLVVNAASTQSQTINPLSNKSGTLGTSSVKWSQIYAGQGRFESLRTQVDVETATSVTMNRANHHTKLCDCTSNAITVNLDAANAGIQYVIKKIDSSANAVTIDANGSETIDGALTATITAQYESVTLVSDGANWFII